ALRFIAIDEDGLAAGVLDDVFERNPGGYRNYDFVAVVDEHLDGVEQRMLAADRGDAFLALVMRTEIFLVAVDDGIAQFGDAGHRGVAREVILDGRDSCLLDVCRSI